MIRPVAYTTAAALAGLASLHTAWGLGSSFPFHSRAELADAVVGAPAVPPPAACHLVAGALLAASGLTADLPVGSSGLRKLGRIGLAGVLAGRGVLGLMGRTELVSPGSSSPRFRRLDRRFYGPLCLALSAGVVLGVPGARR